MRALIFSVSRGGVFILIATIIRLSPSLMNEPNIACRHV